MVLRAKKIRPQKQSHRLKDSSRRRTVVDILKAAAHPVRIQIIAILCDHEQHVKALSEEMGVSQPIVSQQLRILRMRGLVESRWQNGFAYYRLLDPRLEQIVHCMSSHSTS